MVIPDSLYCLFSATVRERDDSYVVEIPKQEVEHGPADPGQTYRVGVVGVPSLSRSSAEESTDNSHSADAPPEPPVSEGDRRTLDIEGIGDQGDGIARVERGFVVIVPGTDKGERVTVQVTDVRENVAFADVIKRHHHYS